MSDERERETKPDAPEELAPSEDFEVFLTPTRGAHLSGLLGWLTRLYGLDVYGGSQLGRQARLALQSSALLLLVIVSFDLMAWTLLFNSIFHASGDIRDVDYFWTPLAAIFGLLFASAVFIYERQFLTTDTSEIFSSFWRFLSVIMAVGLRMVILVVAAVITAQPIELLIFREPIRKRVHEENVREEIIRRKKQIDELREEVGKLALTPADVDARMRGTPAETARDDAEKVVARERATLIRLQNQQIDLTTRMGTLPPESDPSILLSSINKLEGQIRGQRTAIKEAEARLETAQKNYDDKAVEILGGELAQKEDFRAAETVLRRYIDDVEKKGLDEPVSLVMPLKDPRIPEKDKTFSYRFGGTDFFDQLRVLQDRVQGRQAHWPAGISNKKRTDLAQEFALDELSVKQEAAAVAGASLCPLFPWEKQGPTATDPEVERRVAEACLLRRSYWVAYAIAMVIPLLVFAVKFLIPRELKHYFSTRQQAWAGNPEALSYLRGEQRMWDEKRRARDEKRRAREEKGRTRRSGLPWGKAAPDV